ncbi:MAG: glycosyltransferase family 2 protein [Halobacteriota archaeon]
MKTLAAIPCHNEGLAIGSVVLKARKYVDEVLVVDDGSVDDTVEVAEEAGAAVVSHGVNKGKGRAVRTSLRYAVEHGFDLLVLLDGDGQHDPGEIPQLIEPISTDAADLVIGFRSFRQMPFYRRFGRVVLDHVTGAGGVVTDSQCGFRALNRKAVELLAGTLKKDDFSVESEMTRTAHQQRLRLAEVPIQCKYGRFETSTKNPVSHGFGVLGWLIRAISEEKPLFFFGILGFISTAIGLISGANVLYIANMGRGVAVGSALISVLFIVIGVFSVFTGLILNVMVKGKGKEENK